MTITLSLEPQVEAKLVALARQRGMSADELVRAAIDRIVAEVPEMQSRPEPSRSLRGLFSKYGRAPSVEEVDRNRTEMFADFPRTDF